jgi:oxygen-dependent protoporphyrinogen oxidase
MASVGILGAGIAGLTAGHHLQRAGLDVTVFEATDHVGGKIRSERADGYLIEHGPNTVQSATPLMNALIERLDLDDAVVEADAAAKKRYVVRDGTPHPLPTSLLSFLRSDLLSARGKLRLLAEPFISSSRSDADESLADFTRRRLGNEVLDYGLNPFVAGVFAGDPETLSVRHAFERLYAMEREHGSLFRGLLASMRDWSPSGDDPADAGPKRRMFSFRDGLQTLPDRLARPLTIRLSAPAVALHSDGTTWTLTVKPSRTEPETHVFDAVISTMPLHRLGALDIETDLDLSPLTRVMHPPVSVVAMGFRRDEVHHPLDGFGMLVPEVEDVFHILGTIFTSTIFPDRSPDDHVLLTSFIGGVRHPELGRASDDRQQRIILADLADLLNVQASPSFVRHVRWPRAIPQYTTGYDAIKNLVDRLEVQHPGLFLAGNYRQGIAVGDAMDSGHSAAEQCLRHLTSEPVAAE